MLACNKDEVENDVNIETLNSLYSIYKNGKIDECKYNNKIVYVAGLNVYDAGSIVYDLDGNMLGDCNYALGNVDLICGLLDDCRVIY